jgi:DNA-binding PadR family transcriptional regulator
LTFFYFNIFYGYNITLKGYKMTSAEFAILSLIVEQPRHGYEIEQTIEERGMREWTEVGFSSIYYLLNKLEKKKLITSQTEQTAGRGPARKVYRITVKGKDACHVATLEALEIPHRCYPPFQLGLANLPSVPAAVAVDALRKHRIGLIERLRHIQSRREAQQPLPYFVEAMFDHSLTMVDAEKRWIENFIQQMEVTDVEN